jgi:hypothetical protein
MEATMRSLRTTAWLVAASAVALVLALAGCSQVFGPAADGGQSWNLVTGTGTGTCPTVTWNLTAGQTMDVGSVSVTNDAENVYVTYTLDYPGATFGTLHLWVGNDLLNVPSNPEGTPVPGQFDKALGGASFDATGLTSYTFTIPFADLSIIDVTQVCGTNLYVVPHAEVTVDANGDGELDNETAFGGDTPGSGRRWWFYGVYPICCAFGPPPVPLCETAFAKGGWVWTTDKKSNPENLPSLNLTRNRWGWAINLTTAGTASYDIWAGAGLNKTANGTKVGTLTVDWNGSQATVTYSMSAGYYLSEVHLYAGDAKPVTVAPGQYGNLANFDPNATTFTFNVDVSDTDGDGVWLIAHAVSCNQE